MKSLMQYMTEAVANSIKYNGFDVILDINLQQNKKKAGNKAHDLGIACQVKSLKDLDHEALLKQDCRWVVAYPPHTSDGSKVDYWQIYMFINFKSKKLASTFNCEGIKVLYDLKTKQIVNKNKVQWKAKDYKAIRMD